MPKDEPAGKSGLAEQRALAGTQGKKESGSPLKEGAGSLGNTIGMSQGYAGRKLESQSPVTRT